MKIELTEDQAYDLIGMLEDLLPSQEWWVKQYEDMERRGDFKTTNPDLRRHHENVWNKERYENTKSKIAFRKRILTKLAQALVTEQAAKTQANS